MNGNPVGWARPSTCLVIPVLPSRKAQAIGDGPLGASGKPGASVGKTKTIASVCACRLYTARMPLGYMMTVLARVGPPSEKSKSPSAEGDGDDLIGFRAARGGDLDTLPGSFADQRARQR
jgi:hypothetical protein